MSEIDLLIAECENFIANRGIDDGVISAYCGISQMASNEKQIEKMLQCTKRSKELIASDCLKKTGLSMWEIDKFTYQHKTIFEPLDQYYDMLLLEAQNKVFDSYLLYLERNREPKERFYAPKRPQFQKFGLIEAYQGTIDDIYDIVCVSMPPGTGKAQPLYSKVLTPDGFVEMGSIKVGDKVISVSTAGATSTTGTVSCTISQSGWSVTSDGKKITVLDGTNGSSTTASDGTKYTEYTVKITATAAEATNYKSASTTQTIKVKVKAQLLDHVVLTLGASEIAYNSTTTASTEAYYTSGAHTTVNATYSADPNDIVSIS